MHFCKVENAQKWYHMTALTGSHTFCTYCEQFIHLKKIHFRGWGVYCTQVNRVALRSGFANILPRGSTFMYLLRYVIEHTLKNRQSHPANLNQTKTPQGVFVISLGVCVTISGVMKSNIFSESCRARCIAYSLFLRRVRDYFLTNLCMPEDSVSWPVIFCLKRTIKKCRSWRSVSNTRKPKQPKTDFELADWFRWRTCHGLKYDRWRPPASRKYFYRRGWSLFGDKTFLLLLDPDVSQNAAGRPACSAISMIKNFSPSFWDKKYIWESGDLNCSKL